MRHRVPARNLTNWLRVVATYAALVAAALLFLAPVLWMISTSLKVESQVFSAQPKWIPSPPRWSNYPEALASFPFLLYLRNTLLVAGMTTVGTVFSAALPAYGFGCLRWRGRDALFFLLIATLMLPAQVTMLPVFLIFRSLGWTGTFLPLIVPPFLGSAFSIFLLRQFFRTLPTELFDAARIDGCSELGILLRVAAPMARPAIATIALFAFTWSWMDFLNPLIYLHDEDQYTLALGLQAFMGRHASEWALLMAAAAVITLPMVVLFLAAQRAYVKGIALTGLKG